MAEIDRQGALWFGSGVQGRDGTAGITRYEPAHGSWVTLRKHTRPVFRLAIAPDVMAVTRHTGLSVHTPAGVKAMPWSPAGVPATALALGPAGRVWVGTLLGGLVLRGSGADDVSAGDAGDIFINRAHGLPSMTITALAPVPGQDAVWAGTTAGLALVRLDPSGRPEVAQPAPALPPGPVDALAVDAQGTAPDRHGTVWMAVNGTGGNVAYVLGYRPDTGVVASYAQDQGIPETATIDDLAFIEGRGQLVVYAANKLFRGQVFAQAATPSNRNMWLGVGLGLLVLLLAGAWFIRRRTRAPNHR